MYCLFCIYFIFVFCRDYFIIGIWALKLERKRKKKKRIIIYLSPLLKKMFHCLLRTKQVANNFAIYSCVMYVIYTSCNTRSLC
jgi:hypothetical protein